MIHFIEASLNSYPKFILFNFVPYDLDNFKFNETNPKRLERMFKSFEPIIQTSKSNLRNPFCKSSSNQSIETDRKIEGKNKFRSHLRKPFRYFVEKSQRKGEKKRKTEKIAHGSCEEHVHAHALLPRVYPSGLAEGRQ